jgi:hypothetical protein
MSTSLLLVSGCGVLLALLAVTAVVFFRVLRAGTGIEESTTVVRLAPMERLLSSADFDFLASEPGFRPGMKKRLRAQRVATFQSYLSQVKVEFHQLHRQLRLLTLQAGVDSPELAKALVEQRVQFSLRLMQVEYRLFLFRFGMAPVNVQGIATVIEQMREQVAQLHFSVALPSASAA